MDQLPCVLKARADKALSNSEARFEPGRTLKVGFEGVDRRMRGEGSCPLRIPKRLFCRAVDQLQGSGRRHLLPPTLLRPAPSFVVFVIVFTASGASSQISGRACPYWTNNCNRSFGWSVLDTKVEMLPCERSPRCISSLAEHLRQV